MSDQVTLSAELTDEEWLAEIEEIGGRRGYFAPLSADHSAIFVNAGSEVLIVSFDTVSSARAGSSSGLPFAMEEAARQSWSHMSLIAKDQTWFRDPALYAFFDGLVDEEFFDRFETVIFYGAGMCGYAAAAYSVVAPGATVFAIAPQATLDPDYAMWDDRFLSARRRNFSDRYGFAPDMVEAADQLFLIYDPMMELDAMHAALFRGPQVKHIRFRQGGSRLGSDLQAMQVMGALFAKAAAGTITPRDAYRALRTRRDYLPYLRNLLNRVHIEERHWLTAILCRSVLARKNAPRFQYHLEQAEKKLSAMGRSLPSQPAAKAETTPPARA